tara:strand:- start:6398 stop:6847 length:450 start_codon:yes stop_codon:yes gene_type:complete
MDPFLYLAVGGINFMMQQQAGAQQQQLYNRQAQQFEFNADMQKLRGLQESNALTEKFNIYQRQANAQRAKLGRSANDRSINAMLDKARRSNREEQARSLLQNLSSAQQSLGQADISRMEGGVARQTAFMTGFNSLASGFYRAQSLGFGD